MEERFKKLDNFLREQLNGASEDHTWNVPDDAIFEKAMRTVAAQKKKKRRGWILIPIFLGAGLMVSEYYHHREIEILEGKITTLEDKFSRESSTADRLSSSPSDHQEITSSPETSTPIGKQESNSLTAASEISTNTQPTPNPNESLSPTSNKPSITSASKNQSLVKSSTKPKSIGASTTGTIASSLELSSNTDQAESNEFPINAGSDKPISVDPSKNMDANSLIQGESKTVNIPQTGVPGISYTNIWMTEPISTLDLKGLETQETLSFVMAPIAANPTSSTLKTKLPVLVMQYGLLLGSNQSWLTMTNIPAVPDAMLYNYDNSQPGFSFQGFVNKPFSKRFSVQGGLGYNIYRNKSIAEDQFLFDSGNVTLMPDGQSMYQTDYDVINPIGEYEMQLEFRAIDQMHQNDTIVEYTNIEQVMHSVMLDLGLHYNLLTLNHIKISLGTGFGLGYMAGLKNEFSVSTYYNGILQDNQMETPDHLNKVKRWYGQWLGNLNIGYYPTDRLGVILCAQYNAGLTSIRDGGSANGPLTFLHSFGLSAGVSNSF